MKREEAEAILLRYRPSTADSERPEVQEALDVAGADPELGVIVQEHQAFNEAFRRSLRSVQPPPGLKEQILSERVVTPGLAPIRRRLLLAACVAGIVLLLAIFLRGPQPPAEGTFANFRSRMVRTALRGYAMDLESRSTTEIRRFLGTHGAVTTWLAPAGLPDRRLLGCAVLKWQDQPAGLICYGEGDTPDLWLFTIAATAMPDAPSGGRARAAQVNRMNTLSWTENGRVHLLVGGAPVALLRQYAGQSG